MVKLRSGFRTTTIARDDKIDKKDSQNLPYLTLSE